MSNPDFKKWIKLTFDTEYDLLVVRYEDGLGNKAFSGNNYKRVKLSSFVGYIATHILSITNEYFREVLNAEPKIHYTAKGTLRIPLAVYIEETRSFLHRLPKGQAAPDYDLFIREVFDAELSEDPLHQFQTISFLDHKSKTTFQLPINIRFSGKDSEKLQERISTQNWYANNKDLLQAHGMTLKLYNPFYDPEDIDILVLQDYMAEVFFNEARQNINSMPALIIVLDSYPYALLNHDVLQKLGIPCLYLKYNEFTDALHFFEDFIFSIIHDFPLHEGLQVSKEAAKNVQPTLYASPISNQSLRMNKALESFNKMIRGSSKYLNAGNTVVFLNKFNNYSPEIRTKIESALKPDNIVNIFYERTNNLNIHFSGESTGLVPLSQELDYYKQNKSHFEQINTIRKAIVNDKEVFQALRENQERRVDITMDQFNDSLIYAPIYKNHSLKAEREYRVNVVIGQITNNSLMTGDIPPIDPLLPDPDDENGHELEVVIFPKDFTLLSEPIKKIYLPVLGGTEPVGFNIRTPKEAETAELRVDIFHKNHLLQAFLLKAKIDSEIKYYPEQAVTVALDLSTSSRFTNMDVLKDRDLFIGMNDNGNGTHSFFVKKDSIAKEIRGLTEPQMETIQKKFKELLTTAYFNSKGDPRFSSGAKPGDPKTEDFFEQIRNFARFGGELYSRVAQSNEVELWDKFQQLKKSADKEIQIGRHNSNYSFPWSMLYDYNIPVEITGGPAYPVCVGNKFKDGEFEQFKTKPGFGCPHNPDINTFCLEGFWGIRHKIEQIFNNSQPADFVKEITINDSSKIFYSCNVRDNYTNALYNTIKSDPKIFTVDSTSNLMDLLWDVNKRPSALIVFGHLSTSSMANEPNEARIITFPKEDWKAGTAIPDDKWIYPGLLFKYRSNLDKWKDQPLPLIFLINCSSAEFNIQSINTIVGGFRTAGAAAIIGTESDISTGLGQRFIEEILDSIYNKKMELGEAMQSFNKNLFDSGIPHAFTFTCYGNINLKIIKN